MYQEIKIILATKHKKEQAIRKPFEDAFNATIIVPDDYDTDQFGTFTGEIPRLDTAYNTVIKKAQEASLKYGFDYAIANEGSFGPHPMIYGVPADIELITFIDHKNDIVVLESEITTETNYAYQDITIDDDYIEFLEKIKFGPHGLIVRSLNDNAIIAKGINQTDQLKIMLKSLFNDNKVIRLETDMRAMMNPTRMNIINKLAVKLVKRLQQTCNQCKTPGFGAQSVEGNLLCEDCGSETELYKFKVLNCLKCDHHEYTPRPDGLEKAEAKYCQYCNP